LTSSTVAQDTIPDKKEIRKAKFHFAFDSRRSTVIDQTAKFNGITVGVELYEKHRLGIGFHGLQNEIRFRGAVDKDVYPTATDTLFYNFSYSSVFYDRIWLRSKRWELSSPVHFGAGDLTIRYMDTAGVKSAPFINGGSLISSAGGYAQFKVFRWFALGAGAGYRTALIRDENITRALNAPYYQFQFKLLIGELYKIAFRRETLDDDW
jgi:hypothetical protein